MPTSQLVNGTLVDLLTPDNPSRNEPRDGEHEQVRVARLRQPLITEVAILKSGGTIKMIIDSHAHIFPHLEGVSPAVTEDWIQGSTIEEDPSRGQR